jgi:hypothetical protein
MKQLTLITSLFFTFSMHAQDIHFSQYWMNNIQYNSSLAGTMDGGMRFVNSEGEIVISSVLNTPKKQKVSILS